MERGFFLKKKKQICGLKVNKLQLARNAYARGINKCLSLGTRLKQMPKDVKNV